MIKMKYTALFLCLLFIQQVYPQGGQNDPVIIHLPKSNTPGYLSVSNPDGSIKVTGHNGSDVMIKSSLKNKRKFKDYISVATDENGNGVIISVDSDDSSIDLDISVPYSFSLTLSSEEGKIEVRNISGQLAINDTNSDIWLFGIAGSGAVSAVDGNIYCEFANSGPNGPIALNSVDGKVDLSLPPQVKANVKLRSESGEIFTDFDITFNTHDAEVNKSKNTGLTRISMDNWLNGKINGGGKSITAQSVDGNIYIRKGKQ